MGAADRSDLGPNVPVRQVHASLHVVTPGQRDISHANAHAAWNAAWIVGGEQRISVYRYTRGADDPVYGIKATPTRVGNSDWPYGLLNIPVVVNALREPGAYSTGVQRDAWRKGARMVFSTFMTPEVTHEATTKAQFIALGDLFDWDGDKYRVLLVDVDEVSGSCDAYAELQQI